jgi:hypothetical protein
MALNQLHSSSVYIIVASGTIPFVLFYRFFIQLFMYSIRYEIQYKFSKIFCYWLNN